MAGLGVTADPAKYAQAIAAFKKRVPMTREAWDALQEAEREFAFMVSNVAQADMVADIWAGIDKAIEQGTTLEDFKVDAAAGLEGLTEAHVETIFRTNVQGAYSAGRNAILSDPVVKEARPYWRFDAVSDDRVTSVCEEADGTVLPADDPWWESHTPPLHYNCRSQIVALSPEEAEEEGIADSAPEAEAYDGFGNAPPEDGGGEWEPDPREYPGPIADILRDRIR